jgi:asparagine synthase (glutamine-hydrolysing)
MAREARKHVTVILTGDGGDEVFGGYERYSRLSSLNQWKWAAKALKHFSFALNSFGDKERARELLENAGDKAKLLVSYASALSDKEKSAFCSDALKQKNETLSKTRPFFGEGIFLKQMMDFDLQTLLPDDYLMKVNKTSMAHALEPRVPFLDQDFISFTQTIPPSLKVNGGKTKVLLRKAVASVGLPKTLALRSKQGFNVPTRKWLEGELGEIAEQFLSGDQVKKRGWLDARFSAKVLENSKKTEVLWGKRFWTLFALEVWARIFIDPEKAVKPVSFDSISSA